MAGTALKKTKLLQPVRGERKEETGEAQSGVVVVPVVVKPVPVHHHLVVVLVEIRDVEVTVAVLYERIKCHLCHRPLNILRAVSNPAS